MRQKLTVLALTLAIACGICQNSFAATPKEQAFLDQYKSAFEKGDEAALKAMLYAEGADPEALEFFTMMMTAEMGNKISSIELQDLTAEDKAKALAVKPMPNGGNAKLPVEPTKKLVLKIDMSGPNGSGSSTSQTFVALINDQFKIPVPVPVK